MTLAATGYERRIGRFSVPLAQRLAAVVDLQAGDRVLDVACGSGPLARCLAARVGAASVAAVDSSEEAVAACAAALPDADVRAARAEELPYADATFDAVFAQLLVHLAEDPRACADEMRRVARPGAPVVTCVWDFAEGMTPLRAFWDAARAVEAPGAERHDQAGYRFATLPELERLWRSAGLDDVRGGEVTVSAAYADFDDLWEPLAMPDGTPGRFLATLAPDLVARVRTELRARTGGLEGAFTLAARAWLVVGRR